MIHSDKPSTGSEESYSRMTTEDTGQAGWKVESVELRQAANGGFIVRCSKRRDMSRGKRAAGEAPTQMSDYKSDEYAFSSLEEALAFARTAFGGAKEGTA